MTTRENNSVNTHYDTPDDSERTAQEVQFLKTFLADTKTKNDLYLRLEIVKTSDTGDCSKDLQVTYYSRPLDDDEDCGIALATEQVLCRALTDQMAQLQLLPEITSNRRLYTFAGKRRSGFSLSGE